MGNLTMNDKEREQLKAFHLIKSKVMTRTEAAIRLGMTKRWLRKKYRRYLDYGDKGLIHKNRGKPSNKAWRQSEVQGFD